jgi:hypothetical protein
VENLRRLNAAEKKRSGSGKDKNRNSSADRERKKNAKRASSTSGLPRQESEERLDKRLAALQSDVQDFRGKEPGFVANFLSTPEWAAVIGRGKRLAFSPTEKAQIASIKAKRAVGLEGGGSLSSARVQSSRAFALARDGRIPVLPFARSAFLEGFSRAYYDRGECQKLTPAIIAEVPQSRRVLA